MPLQSQVQQRWMFAAAKRGEVPKSMPKRWARETENIKELPLKVKMRSGYANRGN